MNWGALKQSGPEVLKGWMRTSAVVELKQGHSGTLQKCKHKSDLLRPNMGPNMTGKVANNQVQFHRLARKRDC